MGDRWKMKAHDLSRGDCDGSEPSGPLDPDQPISWWEGWPLTAVVLVLTAWHYSWLLDWAWRWFQ